MFKILINVDVIMPMTYSSDSTLTVTPPMQF